MKDWEEKVCAFLEFNERPILKHAGKFSHNEAEEIVYQRYQIFDLNRREQEFLESENEAIEQLKNIEHNINEKKK